jgi:hypothetical protein
MKKLISLLMVFLPVLIMSQGLNLPSVMLKTIDGRNVRASELVQDKESVLIYFFNDISSETVENLEYLQALRENRASGSSGRIFTVYNPQNGNYGNLDAFLQGNSICLETYVDVNGELQRSLGLPVNSSAILTVLGDGVAGRYSGLESCSSELTSMVSRIDPSADAKDQEESDTWGRYSMSK